MFLRTLRVVLVAWLIMLCSLNATALAREVTVNTISGQSFTGELVEEMADKVTLMIEGVTVSVERANVVGIEYSETVEEQYTQKRSELDEQDTDSWYRLAYWLFENKAYKLAQDELKLMGESYPDDPRVARLGSVVHAKATIEAKTKEPPTLIPKPPKPAPEIQPVPQAAPSNQDNNDPDGSDPAPGTLTDEQINAIKVWELDLSNEPAVTIPREVIDEFLTTYHGQDGVPMGSIEQRRFRAEPGNQQLGILFKLKARQYYGQVQVRSDPKSLQPFRTSIHQRYVLNYCGTNRCHGGEDAGNLRFIRSGPNSTATAYTNFFTLHTFDSPRWYMIDRSMPSDSLLIQYGMDRKLARSPHPEVQGWRARFADASSAEYKQIYDWIGSLHRPTPSYGIAAPPPRQTGTGDDADGS